MEPGNSNHVTKVCLPFKDLCRWSDSWEPNLLANYTESELPSATYQMHNNSNKIYFPRFLLKYIYKVGNKTIKWVGCLTLFLVKLMHKCLIWWHWLPFLVRSQDGQRFLIKRYSSCPSSWKTVVYKCAYCQKAMTWTRHDCEARDMFVW